MTTDDAAGPASTDLPPSTYENRVLGCLLGTLAGDAYGVSQDAGAARAGVPENPTSSSVSAATHLTLSTVDGLVEALEWANDGVAADETACLWLAYLRWSIRQGGYLPPDAPAPPARWLDRQQELLPMLLPDADSLSALSTGTMGSQARPLNPHAEGPGAVMRSAPFGLVPRIPGGMVERLTVDAAALTHGSATAKEAAARYSNLIRRLAVEADTLEEALDGFPEGVEGQDDHAADAGGRTCSDVANPTASATLDAAIRAARSVVSSSRAPRDQLATALALAVDAPVPGSSSVVAASLAGGILGALHGTAALPTSYLSAPGVPAVVRVMADTLLAATTGS